VFTLQRDYIENVVVYKWSEDNTIFQQGTECMISIGGGGEGPAIRVEEDLHHGVSYPCETFHNEGLAVNTEFEIVDMEVWGLGYKNLQPPDPSWWLREMAKDQEAALNGETQ